MSDTQQVSIRLPKKVIEWLDKEAKNLSKKTGLKVTRSDIVRKIVDKQSKNQSLEVNIIEGIDMSPRVIVIPEKDL